MKRPMMYDITTVNVEQLPTPGEEQPTKERKTDAKDRSRIEAKYVEAPKECMIMDDNEKPTSLF